MIRQFFNTMIVACGKNDTSKSTSWKMLETVLSQQPSNITTMDIMT